MTAVIDNNVLVSGLLWGDKPGRVLAAVAEGHIHIFLSEELLAELREVLRRRKFAARLALKELIPETALAKVQAVARLVLASPIPAPPALRFPESHRKRIRTTNLLERLFGEGQRRSKVTPRFMNERSGLSLMFPVLVDASASWHGLKITPSRSRKLEDLQTDSQVKPTARLAA